MDTRLCERCSSPFPVTDPRRRFCSEVCRGLEEDRRYRAKHPHMRQRPPTVGTILFVCDTCGQPETAKHRGRHAKAPTCAACKRQARRSGSQHHPRPA